MRLSAKTVLVTDCFPDRSSYNYVSICLVVCQQTPPLTPPTSV